MHILEMPMLWHRLWQFSCECCEIIWWHPNVCSWVCQLINLPQTQHIFYSRMSLPQHWLCPYSSLLQVLFTLPIYYLFMQLWLSLSCTNFWLFFGYVDVKSCQKWPSPVIFSPSLEWLQLFWRCDSPHIVISFNCVP